MRKSPRQPRWDEGDAARVRVLLECPAPDSPSIIASAIERRRYAVRTCEGPSAGSCALLDDGACALVDGADVVVNMLGATPRESRVLPAVAGLRRCPAIVAEVRSRASVAVSRGDASVVPESPDAIIELRAPVTRSELFSGIEEALRRREQRIAWWGDGFC